MTKSLWLATRPRRTPGQLSAPVTAQVEKWSQQPRGRTHSRVQRSPRRCWRYWGNHEQHGDHQHSTPGRTVAVVGDVYRFLATGEDTNGKYAIWEALVPPGGGPPPHVHSREEEGFYILDGEITFTVNGEKIVASAGMFANMPVGTPHSFKNESDRPAKMLITVAPAGLEQMFFEVGIPLDEGATTALPPTKDEFEKLLAASDRSGVRILVPGH